MINDTIGEQTLEAMSNAKSYNDWVFGLIKNNLRGRVAELGAGIGTFSQKIASLKFETTAIDYNQSYLSQIKKNNPNIKTVLFDAVSKKMSSELVSRFDTVITLNVLEHLEDDNLAISHISRMLSANGRLIILVPAFQFAFSQIDESLGHFRRYSKQKMFLLLKKNGFLIKKSKYINPLGLLGWWVAGKVFRQKTIYPSEVRLFDLVSRPLLFLEKIISSPLGISLVVVAQKI